MGEEKILVAGHLSLDRIKTPDREEDHCGIDIVFIGKRLHRICIFSSEIDIHQDSLMTSASKCLAYLCTGYDRYLTLGTDTSC